MRELLKNNKRIMRVFSFSNLVIITAVILKNKKKVRKNSHCKKYSRFEDNMTYFLAFK